MPRFIGRQGKGRMKSYRQIKRIEAEIRNEEYQDNKKKTAQATATSLKETD